MLHALQALRVRAARVGTCGLRDGHASRRFVFGRLLDFERTILLRPSTEAQTHYYDYNRPQKLHLLKSPTPKLELPLVLDARSLPLALVHVTYIKPTFLQKHSQ